MVYSVLIDDNKFLVPERILVLLKIQLKSNASSSNSKGSIGNEAISKYLKYFLNTQLNAICPELYEIIKGQSFGLSDSAIGRAFAGKKGTEKANVNFEVKYELLDLMCYAAFQRSLYDSIFSNETTLNNLKTQYSVNIPAYTKEKFEKYKDKQKEEVKNNEKRDNDGVQEIANNIVNAKNVIDEQVKKYLQSVNEKYSKIFVPIKKYEKDTEIRIEEIIHVGLIDKRPIPRLDAIQEIKENQLSMEQIIEQEIEGKIEKENLEKEVEKKDEKKQEKSSFAIINLIEELDKILIIGDGGAGKTTLSKWIAYHLSEIGLKADKDFHIPVYIDLKEYYGDLQYRVQKELRFRGLDLNKEQFREFAKKNMLLLLADGLDELQEKKMQTVVQKDIRDFLEDFVGCKIVLTTRNIPSIRHFLKSGFTDFELKGLTENQVEDFLEKHLSIIDTNHLLNELKDKGLQGELKNPLILTFIVSQYKLHRTTSVFETKGLLFKRVVTEFYFNDWDRVETDEIVRNINYTEIHDAICYVGYIMVKENRTSVDKNRIEQIIAKYFHDEIKKHNHYEISSYALVRLIESNLFIESENTISFWIKPYRDYFAAEYLFKKYNSIEKKNKNSVNLFIVPYIEMHWEESFVILFGLVEHPELIIDALIPKKYYYYFNYKKNKGERIKLAAKCIGENKKLNDKTRKVVFNHIFYLMQASSFYNLKSWLRSLTLTGGSFGQPFFSKTLGYTKSQEALDYFLKNSLDGYSFDNGYDEVQKYPITEAVLNYYFELFKNKRWQFSVIKHLKDNISPLIVKRVIDLLKKEESKTIAIEFLKHSWDILDKMQKKGMLDSLIEAVLESSFESKDYELKKTIDELPILGYYYCKNIVKKYILKSLLSINEEKRMWALFRILDSNKSIGEDVIEAMLERLREDESDKVKERALEVLSCYSYKKSKNEKLKKDILIEAQKYISLDFSPMNRAVAYELIANLYTQEGFEMLKNGVELGDYLHPRAAAIEGCLKYEPKFIKEVVEKNWEELYFPFISSDEKKKEVTVHALAILTSFGLNISLKYLNDFIEEEKDKEGYNEIKEYIEDSMKGITANIEKYKEFLC